MATSTHFLLCPVGSAGDVYPFVGLGLALRARGHRVTVLTSDYFEEVIDTAGLEFASTLSKEEFLQLTSNPRLWHPIYGAKTIFDSITMTHLRTAYQAVADRYEPNCTVAVTSCLGFGPRIAHDRLGIPLVTLDLQPVVLWSTYDTPVMPGFLRSRRVPHWLKQLQYDLAERVFVDPLIAPKINAFRAELQLPAVRRITRWWHSPQRIVGLFPEWFASPQPDWPPHVRLTQFPLWNPQTDQPLPDDVSQFLAEGDPPIVFTPGTANQFGKRFFESAADACRALKRRGMLFTNFQAHLPPSLPPGVKAFSFAPFRRLLPHVAAIAHHGGIGTTAQAMEAGIPQLIMPLSHDQPDNALRLKQRNIGDSLSPKRFTAAAVAAKLGRLLSDRSVAESCQRVATLFDGIDPLAETCEAVEAMATSDPRPAVGAEREVYQGIRENSSGDNWQSRNNPGC